MRRNNRVAQSNIQCEDKTVKVNASRVVLVIHEGKKYWNSHIFFSKAFPALKPKAFNSFSYLQAHVEFHDSSIWVWTEDGDIVDCREATEILCKRLGWELVEYSELT